jgi:hypothetical protein
MRRKPVAYAAFVVALAASWFALVLWAAGADWSDPLSPATEHAFGGDAFREVFGKAVAHDGRLAVQETAPDFSTLQSIEVNLDAAESNTLRYRFEHFPRTLELSLVFRTAEAPDDVQTVSLPWPGEGTATFDLSHVENWRGTIIEVGFAEFSTAQLVPTARGFAPFELGDVALWSPSWRGDIAALVTDWFGAWPWSQRSVHALGREGDAPRAHSAILFVALAVFIAIVWSMVLLGLRGRRVATIALACAAIGWFMLDLRWQAGLAQRLLATRTLYADMAWPQRERNVGDSELLRVADEIRELLHDEPTSTRILVQSGNGYSLLRLVWHLLPLNVGSFWHAKQYESLLPENSVIVFYASDAWYTDPVLRKLLARSKRIGPRATLQADGFEGRQLVIFRYHHAR